MDVALVCIAKDEDNYIHEWLEYNSHIGFDHIYVYQDRWNYEIKRENVTCLPVPNLGEHRQCDSYNDFLRKHRHEYQWVAFFDVDEYLVLKKHDNVKCFIADYAHYPSIAISWAMFGDNGLQFDGNYQVTTRFTKRSESNPHIKVILNTADKFADMSVHRSHVTAITTGGYVVNGNCYEPTYDVVQLNHYWYKTKTEFEHKIKKGRADGPIGFSRSPKEWDGMNECNIEDLSIFRLLPPTLLTPLPSPSKSPSQAGVSL